jgi:hypothetical protein
MTRVAVVARSAYWYSSYEDVVSFGVGLVARNEP